MKKRLLSILLSLAMALTMLPTAAFAVDGSSEETPQCICTEHCAEGNVNSDCPVCGGADGYSACAYTVPNKENESVDCTGEIGCPAETHNEGCPLYTEPAEDGAAPSEGETSTPAEPDHVPATESGTYEVSAETFDTQVEKATESTETDITFVLTGNNTDAFSGIADKHVTLTSKEGGTYSIKLASELTGDVTLDNVKVSGARTLYACGHTFETTDAFNGSIGTLYGGGPEGKDVTGDATIIIRGGKVATLYGGGLDSKLDGNVYIMVDDPDMRGGNTSISSVPRVVESLHGGGHAKDTKSGIVTGDVTIDFRCGGNNTL